MSRLQRSPTRSSAASSAVTVAGVEGVPVGREAVPLIDRSVGAGSGLVTVVSQ